MPTFKHGDRVEIVQYPRDDDAVLRMRGRQGLVVGQGYRWYRVLLDEYPWPEDQRMPLWFAADELGAVTDERPGD